MSEWQEKVRAAVCSDSGGCGTMKMCVCSVAEELADEYDALAARLAEAERLLREAYDGREKPMPIGLCYRIGQYLNHSTQDQPSAAPCDHNWIYRGSGDLHTCVRCGADKGADQPSDDPEATIHKEVGISRAGKSCKADKGTVT